jgi:tRNA-dihydrouridine synthase
MQTVLLALRAVSNGCNLHVNFAQCGGHYLSDAHETTQNAKGAMVLEGAAQEPWLFAKLPQGRTQLWLTCMVQRNNTSRMCRRRDTQTPLLLVSGTDVTGRGTQRIGPT